MAEQDRLDPVPGSPADTRGWYDRASGLYARFFEDIEFPPTRRAIEWLDLQPDEVVLDVGCGAGKGVKTMAAELGLEGQVIGLDFAAGMCTEARDTHGATRYISQPGVVCGDARSLPLETGRFDAVLSSFVLDLLAREDINRALTEVHRVLDSDGRLAVVSLAETEAVATRVYCTIRRIFPTQLDCRPIPVRPLLRSAGFEIGRTHRYSLHRLPVSIVLAHPVPE